jgi:lysophospholipase L1-like esterase
MGIPPMATWVERGMERNATIREINAALAAHATGEGYVFEDLHPVLADGDGFLRGDVTSDGVHLNAKGYAAVIQRLKEESVILLKR